RVRAADLLVDAPQGSERVGVVLHGGHALDDEVLVPVVALHGERCPRVASQVARLGSRATSGYFDQAVVVHGIANVRELRPSVALDGGEHAAVVARDEGARLVLGHYFLQSSMA